MKPYNSILELLDGIDYQEIEHEAVITSDEAAKVRGLSKSEGMKSLLLSSGEQQILVVVRADNKLDSKKVRSYMGVRQLKFVDPDIVYEVMSVRVGACYPFGQVADLPMIVDHTFEENEFVSFNPGLHEKSIRMRWKDYKKVVQPKLIDIVKT